MNLRNVLADRENWNDIAVISNNDIFTYHDLLQKAAALQKQLPLNRKEHVALFLPDGADYIAALCAVLMSEMTAFPLNIHLTAYELYPLLTQADVRTVVTTHSWRPVLETLQHSHTARFQIICIDELKTPLSAALPLRTECNPQEPMLLLTTSGTTGKAKLVQLSENNLDYCVQAYLNKMDYEMYQKGEVRYVIATPFFSIYGLLIIMACLVKSFPIVLLEDSFMLSQFYNMVEKHKITHYEGGTAMAVLMNQTIGRAIPYDICSLRYCGLAGSKISDTILHRLTAAFPEVQFWTGYGMTEASPLITKPYKHMDPEKFASVGTALPGEKVFIEADGNQTDIPYVYGEVVVKGPNVMLGYYKNKTETDKIIQDGWLHTGDIGYLDEDGYLYICGRKKNVILVRGFNVYAEEVQSCIMASGLVKDCVVYGESGEIETEVVCADVIPFARQILEEDIHDYCRQHLASYKRPQKIRMVSSLEKTSTGKSKKGRRNDIHEID